jgi:hypothetical protein
LRSKKPPKSPFAADIGNAEDPHLRDELLPYNQQKIAELAKSIFSTPPLLNRLLKVC